MSASILVPFSISRSVLERKGAEAMDPAHYRRLVALWSHVGVLMVSDAQAAMSELAELVRELPQESRKVLCEALVALDQRRLRMCDDATAPATIKTCPVAVPDGCSRRAYVHAADARTAQLFRATLPAGFEAVALDVLDQSEAFTNAVTLASQPLPKASDVAAAWSSRVAPLIAHARQRVTLVDHYAVGAARRRRTGSRWEKTGLGRFLKEAAKHKGQVSIEVITADDTDAPGSAPAAIRECAEEIGGRSRRWKVDVFCPMSQRFKGAVHYRGIFVDATSCLLLDYGVEAFNGDSLSRTMVMQLRSPDASLRSDIDDLRRSVKPVVV